MKPTQRNMFVNGEDLPLFSGTAMNVSAPPTIPQANYYMQTTFASCKFCKGTGTVTDYRIKRVSYCFCPAGDITRSKSRLICTIKAISLNQIALLLGLPPLPECMHRHDKVALELYRTLDATKSRWIAWAWQSAKGDEGWLHAWFVFSGEEFPEAAVNDNRFSKIEISEPTEDDMLFETVMSVSPPRFLDDETLVISQPGSSPASRTLDDDTECLSQANALPAWLTADHLMPFID